MAAPAALSEAVNMVAPLLCLMGIGEKEMLEGLREQHAGEQQNDATLPADDPAGEAPVALLHRPAGLEDALAQVLHLIARSEEHTSELQSLMRISYAVFCLKQTQRNHNK